MANFNWGQQNDFCGTGGWVYQDQPVYQQQTVDPTWLTARGGVRPTHLLAANPSMAQQMPRRMPPFTTTNPLHAFEQSLASALAADYTTGVHQHTVLVPHTGGRVSAQGQQQDVFFGFDIPDSRSFQPPQRSMSYAEAASLPGQYRSFDHAHTIGGPQCCQDVRHDVRKGPYPEGISAQQVPLIFPNTRSPAFRLDMRQTTPPDMRTPPMVSRAATANEQILDRWLDQPKTVDERMGLRVDTAAMSAKQPALLSPARSIAGLSDKSSIRRTRKQRLQSAGYKCPQCGEGFNAAENLKKHVRWVHGDYQSRPYFCVTCPKRFWFPKDLDRHQKVHLPRVPEYWCVHVNCQGKNKTFSTKYNFERHMVAHFDADSAVVLTATTSMSASTYG